MKDITFKNFKPFTDDGTIKDPFYTHLELFEFALHFYKQSGYRLDVAISYVLNFIYHGSSRMKVNDMEQHRENLANLDNVGLVDLRSSEIENEGFETYYGDLLSKKYGYNIPIEICRLIMLLDQSCENISSKQGSTQVTFIDKEKAEKISSIRDFVDGFLSLSLAKIFKKAASLYGNKIHHNVYSPTLKDSRNFLVEDLYVHIIHSLSKDDVIGTILATASANKDCILSLKAGNISQEMIQKITSMITLIIQTYIHGDKTFKTFDQYVKYTEKGKYDTYRIIPQLFFTRNSSQTESLDFIVKYNQDLDNAQIQNKFRMVCLGGIQKVENDIKQKNGVNKKTSTNNQKIFYETSGVIMYNDSGSLFNSLLSGTTVISPVWIEKSKNDYGRLFGVGEFSYKRLPSDIFPYSYNAYNVSRTILKFTVGNNIYRAEGAAIDDRNFISNVYDSKGGVDVSKWDAALKINPEIDVSPESIIFTCGFSRHRMLSTDASLPLKRGATDSGSFVILPTMEEFECPKVKAVFLEYASKDFYFFPIYNCIRIELFMEYIHAHINSLSRMTILPSFRDTLKKHIEKDVADYVIDSQVNIFQEVSLS